MPSDASDTTATSHDADAAPATSGWGLWRVQGAVALFGLSGVLGRMTGLPAPLITLGRVVFAGAALAIGAGVARVSLRPRRRADLALLVGQGALLALHWTAFFQAIVVSNVAIGLLAFSTFPLFTVALEPLLLHQRPNALQLGAALLTLPGVALLTPTLDLRNGATQGVLWGLLAGATFALLSVVNRGLTRRYSSLTISLYQDGVAAVVLLPTLALTPTTGLFSWRALGLLLALGLGCTALAHTLFIAGLRSVTAQLASLIGALEPVWGILFAYLLLGEIPTLRTLLGGALILSAVVIPAVADGPGRRRRSTAGA